VLAEYRLRKTELQLERAKLKRLVTGRARTLDGEDVALLANIELPQDAERATEVGADGVGLFRTEFLFMNRDELPGEDEQFEAYRSVVKALAGKPVTIRTLDIGADKEARALRNRTGNRAAPNPALGLRAIRFCLAEPQLFLVQLRAILRASHHGRVRLLIPMLAHAQEIEQALSLIELARFQLREARQKFDAIEVGGMIEIPAAALALGPFLRRLDFLSIGTNDLIQYTPGDRPQRRCGGPPLRSRASGRAQADCADHPERAAGRHAGGGLRRNGRRPEADPAAGRHGPARVFHASGAAARSQAAGHDVRHRATRGARRQAAEVRRARQDRRPTGKTIIAA
jgi:hypothetical protein